MPEETQEGKHASLLYNFICTKPHFLWCPCWRSHSETHSLYMRCWLHRNRPGTTLSNEKLYMEWEFKIKFKMLGFKSNSSPESVIYYTAFTISLKKQQFLTAVNLFFHYWGSSSSFRSITFLCIFINLSSRSWAHLAFLLKGRSEKYFSGNLKQRDYILS